MQQVIFGWSHKGNGLTSDEHTADHVTAIVLHYLNKGSREERSASGFLLWDSECSRWDWYDAMIWDDLTFCSKDHHALKMKLYIILIIQSTCTVCVCFNEYFWSLRCELLTLPCLPSTLVSNKHLCVLYLSHKVWWILWKKNVVWKQWFWNRLYYVLGITYYLSSMKYSSCFFTHFCVVVFFTYKH